MKTPKEFDYDLWKDEAGKCFIRVKRTGEICEVNNDTFKVLRNEAMVIYRKQKGIPVYKNKNGKSVVIEYTTTLSLDLVDSDGMNNNWVSDNGQERESIITTIATEEFKKILTEAQKDILENCLMQGLTNREFARQKQVNEAAVRKTIKLIQKKAKIFFYEGTQ